MLKLMPFIHGGAPRQADPPGRVRRRHRRVAHRIAAGQIGQHVVTLGFHRIDPNIKRSGLIQGQR